LFMFGMVVCFFCNGILFGNYNARALEPMGHIAGVAAAIVGSLSGLVALAIGTPLGRAYDGSVISVQSGFVLGSFLALTLTEGAEWRERVAHRLLSGRAGSSSRA
jgi:MFS transporter, DHA1 family, multidrug resistance protein